MTTLFVNNLNPSDIVSNYVLTANTAVTVNLPAGAIYASITANNDFYANFNGTTAIVPNANVVNLPAGMVLNPTLKWIGGISSISIVANTSTIVTIEYYFSQFVVGFG